MPKISQLYITNNKKCFYFLVDIFFATLEVVSYQQCYITWPVKIVYCYVIFEWHFTDLDYLLFLVETIQRPNPFVGSRFNNQSCMASSYQFFANLWYCDVYRALVNNVLFYDGEAQKAPSLNVGNDFARPSLCFQGRSFMKTKIILSSRYP